MTKLSDSMTEGTVVAWLCSEGEQVRQGQAIAEIETEKSTVDLEAPASGVLARIAVQAGQEQVAVGTLLAVIETDASAAVKPDVGAHPTATSRETRPGDDGAARATAFGAAHAGLDGGFGAKTPLPATRSRDDGAGTEAAPQGMSGGGETAASVQGSVVVASQESLSSPHAAIIAEPAAHQDATLRNGGHSDIAATPLARRMAVQANLDLSSLRASGSDGRIRKADVEAALASAGAAAATSRQARSDSPSPRRQPHAGTSTSASRMRRNIAERMTRAKQTIPHFYLSVDCRVDRLLKTRKRLNEEASPKVSLNDFVVRAAALALRALPAANASWTDQGVQHHDRIDIAVAVALEDGLVTPVVRSADTLGLGAISAAIADLAARARQGRLAPHEYDGGTFTVSNLGMFGVGSMYAIINPPQACILGVGAAEERPVVRDGKLKVAAVMTLTLSADHRVIDGAIGARLLAHIRRLLEEPARMLL
ncbi:MAG TPA: dihydrolipoamide acetyltransferase family protein [Candidatus Binatia bacterium]|nr:dihydrolipoamide acetyltransferase family protein [Candidatus Binatia bacterium]